MKDETRGATTRFLTYINTAAPERCNCPPFSALHAELWSDQETAEDSSSIIPATRELSTTLRTTLSSLFPCSTPLSVMLLHISQLEHISITSKSAILHKRHRYHAPHTFLEQILINVRRAIRTSDQILVHSGTGAAIIFPEVDEEGARKIIERVYHSINLLQPETVIPPLKRETDILIGIGSYPKPGSSFEELLYHAGFVVRKITLRPAVIAQSRPLKSTTLTEDLLPGYYLDDEQVLLHQARNTGIPFMQLPAQIPSRLKQLIPYSLALEIRCAPVGRDHNRLTVAMADPTNTESTRQLCEATGLSIFPVYCDVPTLDMLLANGW